MNLRKLALLSIAGVVLAGAPARAHHSFAAEFDISKPVTLKGTVTKVEWVNPHVYIYLDVMDASGKVTPWSLSTLGPAGIRRAGVTRASFGQGQEVTVLAYHARDGSNFGFMRRMTFADGHTVELWLGDDEAKK